MLPNPVAPAVNYADNTFKVRLLQQVLSHTDQSLSALPGALGHVIDGRCFEAFNLPGGDKQSYSPADFRRFIEAPRPHGCETPIHLVRKLIAGTDVAEAFEEMVRGERGNPSHDSIPRSDDGSFMRRNRDEVTVTDEPDTVPFPSAEPAPRKRDYAREAPTGTSVSYALRRLKTARPDLHEQVVAGGLSPNRAMVEAGFRPRMVNVPADVEGLAAYLERNWDRDRLARLVQLLSPTILAD